MSRLTVGISIWSPACTLLRLEEGLTFAITKGVQFKGVWSCYGYYSKDEVPGLSLLRVTAPREFHAKVGTLSLKYSF